MLTGFPKSQSHYVVPFNNYTANNNNYAACAAVNRYFDLPFWSSIALLSLSPVGDCWQVGTISERVTYPCYAWSKTEVGWPSVLVKGQDRYKLCTNEGGIRTLFGKHLVPQSDLSLRLWTTCHGYDVPWHCLTPTPWCGSDRQVIGKIWPDSLVLTFMWHLEVYRVNLD